MLVVKITSHLAQTGTRLAYSPADFKKELQAFKKGLPELPAILREYREGWLKVHIPELPTSLALLDKASAMLESVLKQ